MGQTLAILHLDLATHTISPLLDRLNLLKKLTPDMQDLLWEKSGTAEFTPFQLHIQEAPYEVTMGSTPSGNQFAVFSAREERALLSLFDIESTLRDQQMQIFELAKSRTLSLESVSDTIETICETISQLIQVDRVGIWLFNDEMSVLEAQNIYDHRYQSHVYGEVIHREYYPTYFEAFENARTIAVHDVSKDPRVKELYPTYFSLMGGIKSMLDAPIMMSNGIGGVLCCESIAKRTWTELDQTLVGTLSDMVAFLYERFHRIQAETKIKELAYVDQLTGLPNQHAFFDQVTRDVQEFNSGAFLYLTIDQFSTIQEVLGLDGGEEVLQETAKRLQQRFSDPSCVARFGMDHFVLYLHEHELEHYEQKLLELKKPMMIKNQEVYITYSFGMAYYPIHGTDAESCLQSAQIALSYGKKVGSRSISSEFNPYMRELSETNLHTEMNLRKGLDMEEFCLYLQPQVNCTRNEVEGFEALIRWNHPEKGLVAPFEFISHAESTGLILPIGEWVIQNACRQLAKWNTSGHTHLTISVNISPRHFLHEKLVPFLEGCIETYAIRPQQLIIEITENVAIADYIAAQERMVELRELGFSISIDDFGTGFSAFVYLQHFPIHEIKIDRRFVRDVHENPKSLGIVKTIVDLATILELRVVVEGAEIREQIDVLTSIGCKTIQGYYFAKPMPITQVTSWLTDRNPSDFIH